MKETLKTIMTGKESSLLSEMIQFCKAWDVIIFKIGQSCCASYVEIEDYTLHKIKIEDFEKFKKHIKEYVKFR